MTTRIRNLAAAGALALLLAPAVADDAPGTRLTTEQLEELSGLVAGGECPRLFERTAELRPAHAGDPDLLVFEGNCHLFGGRTAETVFQPERVEELGIALGRDLSREDVRAVGYAIHVTYDDEAAETARTLFARALELAPDRQDIVVGNVALLVNTGRMDDAVELVAARGASLGPGARNDLGRIVEDLMRKRLNDRAAVFAAALETALPKSANGPGAVALVAEADGRVLQAIEALERAHAREPDRESVTRELVQKMMLARQWNRAIPLLVPLAPSSPEYEMWLGLAREASAPGSATAIWRSLAASFAKADKTETPTGRIVGHYARASSRADALTPRMRLSSSRVFMEGGHVIPALVEAHIAATGPTRVEALVRMTEIYRERGLLDLARAAIDDALATITGPDAPPADLLAWGPGELHLMRARVLFGLREFAAAKADYEAAAEAGQPANDEWALAALRTGERDLAIRLMQEIARSGAARAEWARARLQQLGAPLPD